MNPVYSVLIAMTCLIPVLVNLMWLKPNKSSTLEPKLQSFEDFVFHFETQFIQLFYELSPNIQSISPQSTLMVLLVVGLVAPASIATELHVSMGLQRMEFEDLNKTKETLHRGVALLRNRTEEKKDYLGWSWHMINAIYKKPDECAVQARFSSTLKLFNSSIVSTTETPSNIETEVKESFKPVLKQFQVECLRNFSTKSSHTYVVKNLFRGRVQSLGNVQYFMLRHRDLRNVNNISMIFLNPKDNTDLNTMMSKFSKLNFEDLRVTRNTKHQRSNFQIPSGAWTNCSGTTEFRPFFSKEVPSFRGKNRLEGDFSKFCYLKDSEKSQIYRVAGYVNFNLPTTPSSTDLKFCDENKELREKSSTANAVLKYPFVILVILDKSIIYSSIVRNEKP